MAIVYAGIGWIDTATMRDTIHAQVRLAVASAGQTGGCIYVHGGVKPTAFPLVQVNAITWKAEVVCGMVGRATAVPVSIGMWDTGGPVMYALPLTLTVTEHGEPYLPDPCEFVRGLIEAGWDPTFHKPPVVVLQSEEKRLAASDLKHIHITLVTKRVEAKARGIGRYKDTKYPVEVIVRSEGSPNSKVLAKEGMAEVQRILELNWNYLPYPWADYIEYDDDGIDLSYAGAGRYEWRWNIKLVAKLRGRAGTNARPTVP